MGAIAALVRHLSEVRRLRPENSRGPVDVFRFSGGEEFRDWAAVARCFASDKVAAPVEVVLQAVGDHLGLRQQPRERRQVAAEQVLDQRIVRAAEDGAVRRRACRSAPATRRRPAATRPSSSASGAPLLDGAGQLRAGLLHHGDLAGSACGSPPGRRAR